MSEANWPWFHRSLGRMETEKLLVDNCRDGCFLIRPSETRKGAYVLSLIHQERIHHYRILPNEDSTLSVQAQEGVQQKKFKALDELVQFYQSRNRGIVCGLTTPIGPNTTQDEQLDDEGDDDSDYDEPEEDEDGEGLVNDFDDKQTCDVINKYLLAFLAHTDLTSVDQEFQDRLKYYINVGVTDDIRSMLSTAPNLNCLKQLLNKEVESTHREVDRLFAEIDVLQSLLERVGGAKQSLASANYRRSSPQDSSFDTIHFKLSECSAAIQRLESTYKANKKLFVSIDSRNHNNSYIDQNTNVASSVEKIDIYHSFLTQSLPRIQRLESTAFSTFKGLSSGTPGGGITSLSQPSSFQGVPSVLTDDISFDVKLDMGAFGPKKNFSLKVNLKEGMLILTKQGDSTGVTYPHHDVIQLIKSRSKEQKLGLLFEGQSRKDYTFTNMQAREHFCQLIQMTRNKLRTQPESDSVSVFVGTWNMGDTAPPPEIGTWFKSEGWGRPLDKSMSLAHDIYAIGTQESGMGEKEWITKIKSVLKSLVDIDYEKIESKILWGIRLVILVKPEHVKKISHVQHSLVRTGIGNALGNKGAVGISFYFSNISLAFICCHLTSGTEKCHRRNQNYHDILRGMVQMKHRYLNQFDLTHQFHHLFFLGDLNYRVELKSEDIISHAQRGNIHDIYCSDQLRTEKDKKKVFVGFEEAPILFPPTYRFKKGERTMRSYVYIKKKRSGDRINEPSFCDRVLWKSYPGTRINNTSYGCPFDICTSDHSPVFSTFQIGGFKQHATDRTSNSMSNTFIILQRCSAKILTNSRTRFYIEIHSTCFEGVTKTDENHDFTEAVDGFLRPEWNTTLEPLAKIRPASVEQKYLEQQHILLMLKSTDSDEPYAECCVSLSSVISPKPKPVTRELIHQGLSVGELECMVHVTMDSYKTYDTSSEKDLYGNIEFIRSEMEESLDTRRNLSFNASSPVSYQRPNIGVDSTECRTDHTVPVPIPRSGSASISRPPMPLPLSSTSVPNSTTLPGRPPMPIPIPRQFSESTHKRRDIPTNSLVSTPPVPRPSHTRQGISSEPGNGLSFSKPPPPVPSRRGTKPAVAEKPVLTSSTASPLLELRQNPPVPTRRTKIPGDSPPTSISPTFSQSRPPSSIDELLIPHGLQKYTDKLIENGFDSVKYIHEMLDSDLVEIGVTDDWDRAKLLKVFQSIRQYMQ